MSTITEAASIHFTDSYLVRFTYIDQDGFIKRGECRLYSDNKGAHDSVAEYFSKKYPKYRITRIDYE